MGGGDACAVAVSETRLAGVEGVDRGVGIEADWVGTGAAAVRLDECEGAVGAVVEGAVLAVTVVGAGTVRAGC